MAPHVFKNIALALLVLSVSGLVLPTGAVSDTDPDQPWEEPAIVLEPAAGPNGQYASIGADGNLSVDLRNVNTGAVTVVRDVLTITNNEDGTYRVWVSHDAASEVTVIVDGSRSLQDAGNPVELGAGARKSVSLVIDSRGRSANEVLMSSLTLHAERVDQNVTPTPTPITSPVPTPERPPLADDERPATPTPTPVPADEERVEVEFDVRTGPGETPDAPGEPADAATIREMNISELEEDPTARPKAIVNHSHEGRVEVGRECPCHDSALRSLGAHTVTEVGQPVNLSGTRSLIGQVDGVDNQRRIVKLIDIQVPEDRRDQPATVRITVDRAKFGDTDPAEAVIAHRAADGWQLLDTRIVSSTERSVTLAARSLGFSPFAVFVENQVRYEWTLPDGSSHVGKQVRSQFDEPGLYNVTLTVTDAFERSDAAVYRILANDRPTVAIEGLVNASEGGPSTLRANVSNEFGNVTITWLFADGSTTAGETVTRAFDEGEVVRVTVEDEFGAEGRAEGEIRPAPDESGEPSVGLVQFNLGLRTRIAVVGLAAVLLIMSVRWLAARRYESA